MTNSSAAAPRVLVVEDEYLIRMLLEDMLGELGYGIAAAVGTISEARQIATDGRIQRGHPRRQCRWSGDLSGRRYS